jgi:hypothetical protein
MRNLLEKVLVAMLVFSALATASGKSELKLLYDQHRWFDLREAMKRNEQNVPELYLGAVASAFNNREDAEKYLRRAIARGAQLPRCNRSARNAWISLRPRRQIP